MSFFTKGDIKAFQSLSESAMDSLCTIQRQTTARQQGAVSKIVYTTDPAAVDIPCRLSIVGLPNQLVTADQLRTAARWNVTLPLGTVVYDKDRLIVSGADIEGNAFSVMLDVAGIESPKSFQVHVKVSGTLVLPDNG